MIRKLRLPVQDNSTRVLSMRSDIYKDGVLGQKLPQSMIRVTHRGWNPAWGTPPWNQPTS